METGTVGNYDVMYHRASGAVMMTPAEATPKASKPVIKEIEELDGIAPWGSDNLFPQNVVKDVEKSDLIPTIIDKMGKMLYSGGLRYGILQNTEGGQKELAPLQIPEIDNWLENTGIEWYLQDACHDHFTFRNVFARMRKNRKGDKIARLEVADACSVRLGLQNNRGDIDKAYISYNWSEYSPTDKRVLKIPALDPYFNVPGQLLENKGFDFIAPIRQQVSNRVYYEVPAWNGIRTIGWLDVAYFVPQFKKYLMQNQMTVKLIIKVDPLFWLKKFEGKWENWNGDEKQEAKESILDQIVQTTKGNEKAGGALMLPMDWNQEKGVSRDLITVEPLKQELVGGEYNQDSQEADFHITRAFLPPNLIGITPGKGMGAGSGSDLRVARNNFVMDSKMDMNRILMPLKWISEFNGWNSAHGQGNKITWWFENYYVATLNSGGEVQNTVEKANGDS